MRRRSDTARAATAYHEAGHAVASWRRRFKIPGAIIRPAGDALGSMVHDNPLKGINLETDGSDRARLRAEKAIQICYAGPLAQRHYSMSSWRSYHGASDFRVAGDLALRINGSGEIARTYLKWLEISTKAFVEINWRFITSLAEALLAAETLDDKEVMAAIMKPVTDITARAVARIVPHDTA